MAEPKRCPDCGEVVDLSEEVGIETPVGMFGCPRHVAFSCAENQANQWEMAAFCERQARERAEARVGADDAELCAHARGFLAYDEDVPLKAANDEPTEPEQLGWFTGWLERAWQVKAERAETEAKALRHGLVDIADLYGPCKCGCIDCPSCMAQETLAAAEQAKEQDVAPCGCGARKETAQMKDSNT